MRSHHCRGEPAHRPDLQGIADFVITAQLILSYGVAGIGKLISPTWRSGSAITLIISTRSFGLGSSLLFGRHPTVAKCFASLIIGYELLWFAAPFSRGLLLLLMGFGVVFHVTSAFMMGLNLFPWAFLSAYPLAISAIYRLHG